MKLQLENIKTYSSLSNSKNSNNNNNGNSNNNNVQCLLSPHGPMIKNKSSRE